MRIAHIADTHLGYRQYNIDEREEDFYLAFQEVIDKVLEERVDVLIHSGDLFDSPLPPIKALYVFKEALRRIKDRMKIITILGDHDTPKRRGMAPHALFGLRVLGARGLECIEVEGVLIAGISNLRGRAVDILRQEVAKFDEKAKYYKHAVLVAHQAIDRYLPFEGAYELKEDELPREATYYALGHLHTRVKSRFGRGFLAYAGSTEIVRRAEIRVWKERGKGFYIVDLESDEPRIHEVNLDIRPQHVLEVDLERLEEFLRAIDFAKKPVLHLTIVGEDINRQEVAQQLQELLKGRVLTLRLSFHERGVKPIEVSRGSIRLENLLREYLADEQLASLALELLELLNEDDIDGAIEASKRFMEVSR